MIDPTNMTFQNWGDGVYLALSLPFSFGATPPEEDWRSWAVGFVRAPGLAQRVLPDPYQFTDWREWAMRVNPLLEGLT